MNIRQAIKLLEKEEMPSIRKETLYKWLNELADYREDIRNGFLKRISIYD